MSSQVIRPWAVALTLLGCGPEALVRSDEVILHPDAPAIAPFETCTVTTYHEAAVSRAHVSACSPLSYEVNPPSSGTHYNAWADFKTFTTPVPWGFLVHALEHGAVVIAYRCDGDCQALEAGLQAFIDARAPDPICREAGSESRFILVPDPELEVAFAAVAWEHTYLATCFDLASLTDFVDAHYGHGPESLCAPGVDRSASGWCP
jgi:Protein of unknown function (DUF3105)